MHCLITCSTTLNASRPPAVFSTLTHAHTRLPPGARSILNHEPFALRYLGILYLCVRRSAAWKPVPPDHVSVAMSVEVNFAFLSSFFCPGFVPFSWWKCCNSSVLCRSRYEVSGRLALPWWFTCGFIVGCHTSDRGCNSGLCSGAGTFGTHAGVSGAAACRSPPCLPDSGGQAGAVAGTSQRGI